jgi:hypothetical protein
MPRYFFGIHDDVDVTDHDGIELPDLRAARSEAARALAENAKDMLPGDGSAKTLEINVRDETGVVVLRAWLSFSSDPAF